jgi:hypothetical protein
MSYIDTRDLAAELTELEDRAEYAAMHTEDPESFPNPEPLDEDEANRLAALRELADEIGEEFPHGETMIPVDEFEAYAEEMAEDIGAIDLQCVPEVAAEPHRLGCRSRGAGAGLQRGGVGGHVVLRPDLLSTPPPTEETHHDRCYR